MQSQPERLVAKTLGTSSTLPPTRRINKPLINDLHFEAFLLLNPKQKEEDKLIVRPPLSVFNYRVYNGSSS